MRLLGACNCAATAQSARQRGVDRASDVQGREGPSERKKKARRISDAPSNKTYGNCLLGLHCSQKTRAETAPLLDFSPLQCRQQEKLSTAYPQTLVDVLGIVSRRSDYVAKAAVKALAQAAILAMRRRQSERSAELMSGDSQRLTGLDNRASELQRRFDFHNVKRPGIGRRPKLVAGRDAPVGAANQRLAGSRRS